MSVPSNAVAAGLRAGRTRSDDFSDPDLESTSYTRIANYLERRYASVATAADRLF